MDYSLLLAIEEITPDTTNDENLKKTEENGEFDILNTDYLALNESTSSFTDKFKKDTIYSKTRSNSSFTGKWKNGSSADNKRQFLS